MTFRCEFKYTAESPDDTDLIAQVSGPVRHEAGRRVSFDRCAHDGKDGAKRLRAFGLALATEMMSAINASGNGEAIATIKRGMNHVEEGVMLAIKGVYNE